MSKRREQIANSFEAAVNRACERASAAVEMEIGRTVADWNKRFPRHRFRVAVSHGMLDVECLPAFQRESRPQWWPDDARGAAAIVKQEAQALIDWHCELDRRAMTFDTADWIEG